MKNIERALVATGVALVFSGGLASAAILWDSSIAAAAQPAMGSRLAARIGTGPDPLADNGPHGGADLIAAAATYIGISATDLHAQLASGKSLAEIAVANGKTRDGLIAALVAAEQQAISTLVDRTGLAMPGHPGPGGPGFGGAPGFGFRDDPFAAAATFLGTTEADLRAKLAGGQTLAQIATAAGKNRDALIAALVADAKTKIEQAKTDGKLTADQATRLETALTDRITRLVDSARRGGPPHR